MLFLSFITGKYDHMDVVSDTLSRNARAKSEVYGYYFHSFMKNTFFI